MAEKKVDTHFVTPGGPGIKIRKRGVFDLPDFYRWMQLWLEDQGYFDGGEETLETRYIERRKPPIKNYEIEWDTYKEKNNYFTHKMKITMLIVAVKPGEMEFQGQKVEAEKGDAQIHIRAWVETPKWEELGFFGKIYAKFIAYRRLREEKVALYKKVYLYQSQIKEYLGVNQ